MKRLGLFLMGGVLLAAVAAAKEYKVGYIDTDRIVARYEAAIEAKRQLDSAIAKFETRADSLKQEYEQAKSEYESQQLTLSEDGKRAKQAEVEQRRQRHQNYLNEVYGKNGRIEQKNQELIAPIVERIDTVVGRIATEEAFTLVIDAAKAGIVFSQLGLDMTQLVIDELNREFEPVAATQQKISYAVVKVWDMNDQAQQEKTGEAVRAIVYDLFEDSPQADMLALARVDDVARERGFLDQQMQLDQALEVARALDAGYVVYGFCSQRDRKTTFELSIADARVGTMLKTQSGEADRPEALREQVGAVVRVLLSSVQRP